MRAEDLTTAVIMLDGLIAWGPARAHALRGEARFVWGLIAGMYTGNVMGVTMVLAFVPHSAAVLRVPLAILTPLTISVCAVALFLFALPVVAPGWRRLRGVPVPAASPWEP